MAWLGSVVYLLTDISVNPRCFYCTKPEVMSQKTTKKKSNPRFQMEFYFGTSFSTVPLMSPLQILRHQILADHPSSRGVLRF